MESMDIKTVITEKTVFGGDSIARIGGKTVFIPYSLPDEKLDIRILQHKNDYDNAEIVQILTPSPHRTVPKCRWYGTCGGCSMMHIDAGYQTELRKEMLSEMFLRQGLSPAEPVSAVTGPSEGYRSRFQLNGGGFSGRGTNRIVPVDSCVCAEAAVNSFLSSVPAGSRPGGRCHVFGGDSVVSAVNGYGLPSLSVEPEKGRKENRSSAGPGGRRNTFFQGTVLSPENMVTVRLGGKDISFDVRGFFQSNTEVFMKAVELICGGISGNNVLDMYSGCGSISVFLADRFSHVTMVEHNRDAVVYAEMNMAGKPHSSFGMSGASWVKRCADSCGEFDAAVTDPPRSGMEPEVRSYLCRSGIPSLCSLSCNPSTHARDCAELVSAGYTLDRLFLLDFYPNTSHIESLAFLSRR